MKKILAMMLVAAMGIGLIGTAQPAEAGHRRGHGWFGAGAVLAGLVVLDAVLGSRMAVCEEPAPVYCPPPVVYTPPPVVYAQPVVYRPIVYRPVVVAPPVIHRPPVFRIQPVPAHPGFRPDHRDRDRRDGHRR